MSDPSPTEGHHVAVLAFPFASHPSILFLLVQKLASAAPNVRFSFFNTTFSNKILFSKVNLEGYENVKPCNIYDGAPEGYVFAGNPMEPIEFFIKATPENFRSSMAEVVKETGIKISCLLTDAFLWFSGNLAEEMGIPWVAFWTGGPSSLSLHIYTDAILEAVLASNDGAENVDRTLEFLPGMSAVHISDVPDELLHGHLDRPFPHMLYNVGVAVPRATAVVLNTFHGMDPMVVADLTPKMQKLLTIGPLAVARRQSSQVDESGCLSWLDKQGTASVAYISFGTMLTPPPPEIVALAETLEEKRVPYLWSFRDNSKLHLLKGFFERTSTIGKVVPWSPQLQVLGHSAVGVFITHGGWSSILESILGGVPMICRPFFGDQRLNRRLIQDVWQIGVGIEQVVITKKGMLKALDLVFSAENGNKMRNNIAELEEIAMKAVAANNGSSTENFNSLLQIITSSKTA